MEQFLCLVLGIESSSSGGSCTRVCVFIKVEQFPERRITLHISDLMKENFKTFHRLRAACIMPSVISLMIHVRNWETFVITVLYHPLLGYSTLHYSCCNKTVNLKMWAALRSPCGSLISLFLWKYVVWWIQWAF